MESSLHTAIRSRFIFLSDLIILESSFILIFALALFFSLIRSSVTGRNRGSSVQLGLTADAFSKFFSDKVDDVRSSTAGSAEPEYTVFHGHPLGEFIHLSISDVVRLIRDSPSKACGLDPIPT